MTKEAARGWGSAVNRSALVRASGYSLEPTAYSLGGGRHAP